MKKIVILLLIAATGLSCRKDRATGCEPQACYFKIFHSITIKFVDKNGVPAEVKNYSVVNQRTGDEIKPQTNDPTTKVPGVFVVIEQAFVRKLTENGEELKITGTSVATNQTKTAIIKVAGGQCACEITKISGPEQIVFD